MTEAWLCMPFSLSSLAYCNCGSVPAAAPFCPAAMPLEGLSPDDWVMFDTVLIVRDLFTGGTRSFTSTADARQFRAAVYQQYGE